MEQTEYRPSKVSTVLAVVFGGLVGLVCLLVFVSVFGVLDEVVVDPLLVVLFAALYGACAGFSLAGCVLLLQRKPTGVRVSSIGSVLALVIVLAELVVNSLPEYASSTGPANSQRLGILLLFGTLALVQARRKDTRHWVGLDA
ncbi:hypothetical protein [Prauserella endophytica]|uniref:Uncharacterized protein n=1 Tax=Prauserella endophytica TaxID=1592324 RepID=A0ABY2S0W7_9PSEU|nr:hypothetical protein [Prauserella endophytica]TKG65810.1 hypothetical protein FCN18_26780 [Prauserella endophytica]